MDTLLLLIRHAESEKNLKNIHGGSGEKLTAMGKKQAKGITRKLEKMGADVDNAWLIYPDNVQTFETAEIISNGTGIQRYIISAFSPLYMGVIHGLSNKDVAEKYPEIHKRLCKWREKEMEIGELEIPQMEPPEQFYERGKKILESISNNRWNIFIATNSLYILLLNIIFGNTCKKGGGYIHFDIQNCGMSCFDISKRGTYRLNIKNTDVRDVLDYALKKDDFVVF